MVDRDAPEDVAVRHLDGVQPEGIEHAGQDHDSCDDRRRTVRIETDGAATLGDGAFGFSGMEWDTLARHGVGVVGVMGNNGIWGLEKHPMEFLYGYSVVADLRPETRYDTVVEALGGQGALVREPAELKPALERALAADGPALGNVLTDPSVAYPRSANLA